MINVLKVKTYNIFHQLRSVAPNSFNSLKNIDFAVLNYLLDASVSRAINSASRLAISENEKKTN